MKNLLKKIVKNKKLLALIIIIAVILVIAGLYGTFASNSTVVGSADTYTITLTDERNTLTVPANSSKTVIYQVTNTNKGTVKYGVGYSGDNITVKVYSDSQDKQTGQFDYGDTKFIKLRVTNSANVSNEATITSVLGYKNGGSLIVPSGVTLVTETYTKGNKSEGNNEIDTDSSAYQTLLRLDLIDYIDYDNVPDFSLPSGDDGYDSNGDTFGDGTNGIYMAHDDLGESLYFRGAVDNNYVSFANMLWRIVRINGDGSIRIVLDPSVADADDYNYNLLSKYNFPDYDDEDNSLVGYMRGDVSYTYDDTHANIYDSYIKAMLDSWYEINIGYSNAIVDAIYCNDRSISNANNLFIEPVTNLGYFNEPTAYSGYDRIFVEHTPTLICQQDNDKFTVNTNIGNGNLTYPIGLLTLDEFIMAGAGSINVTYSNIFYSPSYYLYSDNMYWTMTPIGFSNSNPGAYTGIINEGAAQYEHVTQPLAALPVISIDPMQITFGDGTLEDPFVVQMVIV